MFEVLKIAIKSFKMLLKEYGISLVIVLLIVCAIEVVKYITVAKLLFN